MGRAGLLGGADFHDICALPRASRPAGDESSVSKTFCQQTATDAGAEGRSVAVSIARFAVVESSQRVVIRLHPTIHSVLESIQPMPFHIVLVNEVAVKQILGALG